MGLVECCECFEIVSLMGFMFIIAKTSECKTYSTFFETKIDNKGEYIYD